MLLQSNHMIIYFYITTQETILTNIQSELINPGPAKLIFDFACPVH